MEFDLDTHANGDGMLHAGMNEVLRRIEVHIRDADPSADDELVEQQVSVAREGILTGLAKLRGLGPQAVRDHALATMFEHGLIRVGISPASVPNPYPETRP